MPSGEITISTHPPSPLIHSAIMISRASAWVRLRRRASARNASHTFFPHAPNVGSLVCAGCADAHGLDSGGLWAGLSNAVAGP